MMKQFDDTNIPQTFSTGIFGEKNYNVAKEHAWKIVDVIINGVTEVLRDIKSKENPVAFVFKKGDDFLLAAMVEYFPNEDDVSKPGNWNYTWTFNKDDVYDDGDGGTRLVREVSPYDSQFCSYFRTYGTNKYCMGFKTPEYQGDCSNYMFGIIKKWLDENASETEEVGVEIEGIVEFKVAVEDGEKVFSCEVDGEIKQLIKDDAAIEV